MERFFSRLWWPDFMTRLRPADFLLVDRGTFPWCLRGVLEAGLPSRELTYPTNGKGNSFSQLPLDGIWYASSQQGIWVRYCCLFYVLCHCGGHQDVCGHVRLCPLQTARDALPDQSESLRKHFSAWGRICWGPKSHHQDVQNQRHRSQGKSLSPCLRDSHCRADGAIFTMRFCPFFPKITKHAGISMNKITDAMKPGLLRGYVSKRG